MKSIKTVSIIFISCFILFLFLRNIFLKNRVQEEIKFKKECYSGTIMKLSPGGRGSYWISFSDTTWQTNIFEEIITNYIQVGDSISKEKGTAAIKVYRKDKDSIWQERVFE